MQNSSATTVHIQAAPLLDQAAQVIAKGLSKFTRITGAGAFWIVGGPSFWDAWREPGHLGGGSFTARLGRLEVVVDM